jgi:tight adherence protein B
MLVDGLMGFIRRARGIDEEAVERRLSNTALSRLQGQETVDVLLRQDANSWMARIPVLGSLRLLLLQSGKEIGLAFVLGFAAVIGLILFLLAFAFAPPMLALVSIPFDLLLGFGLMYFYLSSARAERIAKFEEQLPDAIDLVVRSLRVGHPLSSALGVIGRELPDPIGAEFRTAANQVSYGKRTADALSDMQQRIPASDLSYLVIAVQIQEESGGNMVESLSKLCNVIRERFRMFRKAKAITAEGRISAWLLSFFPIGIGVILALIRPGYYTQAMSYPNFWFLAGLTVVLLILNIFMMQVLTKLRV